MKVLDFGLAMPQRMLDREENKQRAGDVSGTPAYMSPEQVRGETHRLDGRTDIWSLGVILYEMLLNRRPFGGQTLDELFTEIQTLNPCPLRQLIPEIPRELERICLSCLEKRSSDRYLSVNDLLVDLRNWLESRANPPENPSHVSAEIGSDNGIATIVPKGIRSFDEADSEFFLELLPGPCDREGLPASIRFWKTRVEQTDPDQTFRVGVIYGPSGCGKTSLVRAGLLPRLAVHVIPIYIAATADDTETRLLRGLAKRVPEIQTDGSLSDAVRTLRDADIRKRKILIVIDQFEQWLHGSHELDSRSPIVNALRHCDGQHVQCIVMVRDDFWLAVCRFMRALEIPLQQAENCGLVDLIDKDHARKLLRLFGQAYGRYANRSTQSRKQEDLFIEQSVDGLAEEGKVVCVRLALFADMMKHKPWVPSSLQQVGGIEGVGVTFLKQTFSNSTSPPEHRIHQRAAREVLNELLPEPAATIKGHMRSRDELLETSGYSRHSRDFAGLLHILDHETRLITPIDPEGLGVDRWQTEQTSTDASLPLSPSSSCYYQLTHDYLVPSLQEWLDSKQKETRRGRAQLRLVDQAAFWKAKPENRRCPSWREYLNIWMLTRRDRWTEPERQMMKSAGRLHRQRLGILMAFLLAFGVVSHQIHGAFRAAALVDSLCIAKEESVPRLIAELDGYQRWARPRLETHLRSDPKNDDERRADLHVRLALVETDDAHVAVLFERLLGAALPAGELIRTALVPYQSRIVDDLWRILHDTAQPSSERQRAGLALAKYSPNSPEWDTQDYRFLADQLVSANSDHQPRLREYLRPIKQQLQVELERVFETNESESKQLSAANALVDLSGGDAPRLARLLTAGTTKQFEILYPVVADLDRDVVKKVLQPIVNQQPADDMGSVERIVLGQRRAGAAIGLLRMGARDDILNALRVGDDPEALTQFVYLSPQRGVTAGEIFDCLQRTVKSRQTKTGTDRQIEDRVLFGLLLAMGKFRPNDLPKADCETLVSQLSDWYSRDPSSSLHGATGWLLRHWGYEDIATQIERRPVVYDPGREWFTLEVIVQDAEGVGKRGFYLTFVVFPAGEYAVGSPEDEFGRHDDESQRVVHVTRPFAVLDREITGAELTSFGVPRSAAVISPTPYHAACTCTWYEAVRFCRWMGEQHGLSEDMQAYPDPNSLDETSFPPISGPRADRAPRDWPLRLRRRGFRLPTEAEWEIACRGGMRTAFACGSDPHILSDFAWIGDKRIERQQAVPRRKAPNLRGLFDTHGNVWEWCHDSHDYWDPRDRQLAVVDPMGPSTAPERIYRGGAWNFAEYNCRASYRQSDGGETTHSWLGFRIAMTLEP